MSERIPYHPQLDMQQIRAFDERLGNVRGTWTTIGRSFVHAGAPGVIHLQWSNPDERWCDERSFLDFLDQRAFRRLLRCFLRRDPLLLNEMQFLMKYLGSDAEIPSRTSSPIWKTEQLFQKTGAGLSKETFLQALHFLHEQDFITAYRRDEWITGSALESIENMGPTFEWIAQAHLQDRYRAVARRCVSFREWQQAQLNDLDVLAFTETQVITIECKSSDFTQEHLARFVRRAQAFPADIALLLVDTMSSQQVTKRSLQINALLGSEAADGGSHHVYQGSLIVHAAGNMYIANTAGGIAAALDGTLHYPQ